MKIAAEEELETPVLAINGKGKTFDSLTSDEQVMSYEAELMQRLEALKNKKQRLAEEKKQAEIDRIEQLKREKDALLEQANYNEELSLKALSTKDKKFYVDAAMDARKQAREINVPSQEDAMATTSESTELPNFWERNHNKAWAFSLLVMFVSIFVCYYKMMAYKDVIQAANAKNAASDNLTQMLGNPYDESSIQKIFYDNLVQLSDVPKFFVFLLILVPFILFYILPFVKTKKDIWTEFFELQAAERHWLTFAWSALLLLVFTLYHLGSK